MKAPRPASKPKEKGIKIGEPAGTQPKIATPNPGAQQGEPANTDRKGKRKLIEEEKKAKAGMTMSQSPIQTTQVNTDESPKQVNPDDKAATANPDGGAVVTLKVKPGLAPGSLLRNTFVDTPKIRSPDEIQDEKSEFNFMRAEMVLKERPSQMGNRKFGLGSKDLSK